ncbi:NF-kappa-B inhibitor cactus-like [Bactrocera dorsalis]|uniref:NF-kappa-B inhibitor cactus-like n=1 Tax=Bactrocera dorsalis TaxID=27457 RepID=A0ABM3J1V8_BACDO|nr:NF-kappa-B inhibitor cactus-like [Bactrocera dorsalis]
MSKSNPAVKCITSDNENTNITDGSGTSGSSILTANADKKQIPGKKEFSKNIDIEDQSQGIDSGFLSGPQSSSQEEQEEAKYSSDGNDANDFNKSKSKSNVTSTEHHVKNVTGISKPHDKIQENIFVVDSGCIEEEYEEFNDSDTKSDRHLTTKQTLHSKPQSATAATKNSNLSEEMRLKHDVDSHISERFCNLSLESGTANNLNAADRIPTLQSTAVSNKSLGLSKQSVVEQIFQQNDDGDTYLHLACISGQDNLVAALIPSAMQQSFLNIKNDYEQTPLHLAALYSHKTILRMLLLAGAEPNIRDCDGNTALHIACENGDEQSVIALTTPFSAPEINAAYQLFGFAQRKLVNDFEIRNYNGEYCVHLAAERGNLQILRPLVQSGANINAREGRGGYTPLHISVERNNEELLNFLLNYCKPKLNLEATTFGRRTAYQLACISKRSQMQLILEKHGAKQLPLPDEDESTEDESSDEE